MIYVVFNNSDIARVFVYLAYGCRAKSDFGLLCLTGDVTHLAGTVKKYDQARQTADTCGAQVPKSIEIMRSLPDNMSDNDSLILCFDKDSDLAAYNNYLSKDYSCLKKVVYSHNGYTAADILNIRFITATLRNKRRAVYVNSDKKEVAELLSAAMCIYVAETDVTSGGCIEHVFGKKHTYYDELFEYPIQLPQVVLSGIKIAAQLLSTERKDIASFVKTRKQNRATNTFAKELLVFFDEVNKYISSLEHKQIRLNVRNDVETIIKCLNEKKELPSGNGQAEHDKAFVRDILSTVGFTCQMRVSFGEESTETANAAVLFNVVNKENILGCNAAERLTELAYETGRNDTKAQRIISHCIDWWEIFYRYRHETLCEVLNVKEAGNGNFIVCLQGQDKVVAETSSLTGFSVCQFPMDELQINEKKFFGVSRTLNERDIEFQKFIYGYVIAGEFSKYFTDYVRDNLSEEAKKQYDESDGFFALFPQFGKSVPIYSQNN